jgi:HPt (histidine-containing phosphotransfer) domain-containing protein
MGLTAEALQRIREAVGDDDVVVADILQSFVDEVDALLNKLFAAAEGQDAATLRRIAHTLKSSCRDLGDHITGALCADLEERSHKRETHGAVADAVAIADACRKLKLEVQEYIAGLGTDGG